MASTTKFKFGVSSSFSIKDFMISIASSFFTFAIKEAFL